MAGSYFRQSRNIELSTLDYITSCVTNDWTGITVVKTFKDAYDNAVPVPIICIRLASTNNARREIGAVALENRYMMMFDIFSRSDAQRVDLSDYIVDKLKDGWVYNTYAHASGDKSQIEAVPEGRIFVTDWMTNTKIDFGENVDPKDRYRHTISVLVRRSTFHSYSSSSSSSFSGSQSSSSSSRSISSSSSSSSSSYSSSSSSSSSFSSFSSSSSSSYSSSSSSFSSSSSSSSSSSNSSSSSSTELLVAHWDMNDNAPNTNVLGSLGIAQRNTNLLASSKINGALSFNGSTDQINLSSYGSIDDFSVAFWYKRNNASGVNEGLISRYHAGGSDEYFIEVGIDSSNNLTFFFHQNSSNYRYWNASAPADTAWHHYVGTRTGNTLQFYLDGTPTGSLGGNSGNIGTFLDTGDMNIGWAGGWGGYHASGIMDDVRFYSTAITQDVVDHIYNAGKGTESEFNIIADDLKIHLKMNDNASNTTVIDSMNTINGVAQQNTNLLATARVNSALSFNGVNDYINCADIPDFGTSNFSLAFWVKANTSGELISKRRSAWAEGFAVGEWPATGQWCISFGNNSEGGSIGWTGPAVIGAKESGWTHLAIVRNGDNLITYKNGVYANSFYVAGANATSPASFKMGYDNVGLGGWLNGFLDDVRIYSRALTEPEVNFIYNSGEGTESETFDLNTNLVTHYLLNDATTNTTITDNKGSLNEAAQRNTNLLSTSKINSAITFNGSDYVTTTYAGVSGANPQSISLWFNTSSSVSGMLLFYGTWGSTPGDGIWISVGDWVPASDGKVHIEYDGGFAIRSTGTYNDGLWHHLVWTYDGINSEAWVDNVSIGTSNYVLNIGTTYPVCLGYSPRDGIYLNGQLDDVRLYNAVLTSGQRNLLWNSGIGTESEVDSLGTNLIAHYLLNDDLPTTTVLDNKGGYHGVAQQNTNLLSMSKINSAIRFNGTTDYIDLSSNKINVTGPTTITFWAKSSTVGINIPFIVDNVTGAGIYVHMEGAENGPIILGGSDYCYFENSAQYADGIWHHWAFQIAGIGPGDSLNSKLWIDGNEIPIRYVQNAGSFGPSAYTMIGYDTATHYNGMLDDIRIYNAILSESDIKLIYNSGHGTENE